MYDNDQEGEGNGSGKRPFHTVPFGRGLKNKIKKARGVGFSCPVEAIPRPEPEVTGSDDPTTDEVIWMHATHLRLRHAPEAISVVSYHCLRPYKQ